MPRSGQDPDSTARRYQYSFVIHFHENFAVEDVEELLGVLVMMANLGGARRHELFDDAQVLVFDQIPAIAVDSPAIVFGILAADGDGRSRSCLSGRLGGGRFGCFRHVRAPLFSVILFAMSETMHSNTGGRELLRHTLATLAYRGAKVLRDVPANFDEFQAGSGVRTPGQILAHLGDLLDWGLSMANGERKWHDSPPLPWDQGSERFFAALKRFDDFLAANEALQAPLEKLFQGPIADALAHVGQIAILRRMAGSPVKGENYYAAEIQTGRVGADQAKAKREF